MSKVLFIDSVHDILEQRLKAMQYTCEHDYQSDRVALRQKLGEYEGIVIRSRITLDEELLNAATSLKWIARSGSGLENIRVAYAESKGIRVFNSPEGNKDAVAEHALAMLLALFNNIIRADAEVRRKEWRREANRGIELKEKTVGIIGFGVMGSAFAERLSGFGCKVMAFDKYKKHYAPAFVTETSLEEIFREADIVSLHVPLTQETRYLAHDGFFSAFQKPIYILNTSRGPVLEVAALNRAMDSGKVAGACLDVLEFEESSFEKLDLNHPEFEKLSERSNVILSPHIGGWTRESYIKLSAVLADKIEEWKNGPISV